MQRIVCIGLFIWLIFAGKSSAQKLIINEASNGPNGNKEYVEFVVVDTTVVYDCNGSTPPCIDIRGWIFDDNSGYHGGSGVAPGCMRFSYNTIWSCVPVGTIILIYNAGDRNGLIPPDDLSLSDGNCRIIAPDNNATLFDRNTTTPGAIACSYPGGTWSAGGSWNNTIFANPGDCARLVNLSGCEVFSVCWGSDNQNNLIYFAGDGAQNNWYFNSGDPTLQSNWSQGNAGTNETPGSANNAANLAYINQFNNGCNPITPLSVISSSSNSGCTCSGTASVTASGSIGPYTYNWSNGASTAVVTGLCAGVYTVTVTSAINCTQTLTFTITASGSPNANAGTSSTITCTSPTAILNGSSTTPGATLSWAGPGIVSGGSTATPTVNAAGIYTLTVSTAGGCVATSTVSVTSNTTPPNVSIAAHPPLTCTSTSVTLVGSSTTPGATFQWTGGPATSNYTVSATGGYTLTVINPANGCTASATSGVSSNTTPPNVSIAAPGTITCSTTTVTLTGASTTPGASFQWTGGPATAGYPITTPGVYTLTVTSPFNGCTNTATTTVTSNTTTPNASIATPASLTCTTTTVTLAGASTTPGATFQWTGGPATANNAVSTAGVYTLTVTNPANGCTSVVTTTVTNTASTPNVSISAPAQLTCTTTALLLNGSSTTPGVNYSWTGPGIASGGSTATPSVNAPGIYTLTVTDPGSCTNTATVSVTSNTTLPNAGIAAPASLSCTTATVTLAGSSTTPGAIFQWTSGPATATHAVTTAGVYTLTVTNPANGCTSMSTVTVISNTTPPNVNIAAPATLSCSTTTVTLNGSSSTPGATFQWTSGPATATNAVTAAGVYTLTVTDPANGCISVATTTVSNSAAVPTISIAAPAQLTCATTTLTLTGSSTTPGVSYSWVGTGIVSGGNTATPVVNAAGVYTLTVTDPGSCTNTATISITANTTVPDISIASPSSLSCTTTTVTLNGSSTTPGAAFQWTGGPATASNAVTTAGIYTLTITDPSNGCTSVATTTVVSNTAAPNAGIAAPASLTCVTSSVTLAGSSTTPGATFQWTTGPATNNYTVTTAGIYTLTVTDPLNGCTTIATTTVTSNTTSPNVSIATPATLNCITPTVTITGGSTTPGATFQWTGGPAAVNYPITTPGVYTVTATDPNNGCTAVATTTVSSNTTAPNAGIAPPSTLTCTTATITLTSSSTTPGAIFQWTGGPATATYPVTAGGIYTLTVTDPANGCTTITTTTVSSSIVLPDVSIAAPGSLTCVTTLVTLTGSSISPGVTYQWTSGPAAANYAVTTGGTYTLTVTDPSNSCTNTATVTVLSNTNIPDVNIATPATLTCITLTSTLAGASTTPGVTFQWTSGPASANYIVAAAGTYTLTVTDPSNGCTNTATATVSSNTTTPDVSIASPATITCLTPTVTLTGSSTTSGALYQWTSGPATATYNVNAAGTYSLTVTDPVNGCTVGTTATVTSTVALPDIGIAAPDTITCLSAFVTISGSSTTAGATYQWISGPPSPVNTVSAGGTYTLEVTDPSNGCVSSGVVTVIASNTPPDVSIAPPAQLNCINSTVTLSGSSATQGVGYQWTGGPAVATYTINTAGIYTLTVTNNANGCINTATTSVVSNVNIPDLTIAVPQVITCANPTVVLGGTSSVSGLNYQWTSGPASSNYTVSVAGIYTLTASNPANGCTTTASVTVTANTTAPGATFTNVAAAGCAPVCISLHPDLPADPAWQYTWTFSDGSIVNGYNGDNCFTEPGIYDASLSVTDPVNGCSASSSVTGVAEAYVVPDAAFSYNPMNPTTYDPMVVFTNESMNADTYVWTFDGDSISTLQNPVWSFDLEGNHPVILYAQNSFGCLDSIEVNILVEGEFVVYVPNAFTPSGDVYNETWRPVGVGVDETDYELSVYDRWGTRIFHTTDWEHGAWDGRVNGTLVQVDTYIYKIRVSPKIKNGQYGPKQLNGHVHVVR